MTHATVIGRPLDTYTAKQVRTVHVLDDPCQKGSDHRGGCSYTAKLYEIPVVDDRTEVLKLPGITE